MLVFVFLELKVVIGVHCSLTEFETVDVQEETNGILCEEIFEMMGRAGFKSFRSLQQTQRCLASLGSNLNAASHLHSTCNM